MKFYYLASLGYHMMSTFKHMYDSWFLVKKDFLEMLLHHILTMGLFMFSYMINLTKVGSLVMFLHDIADVPIALLKSVIETTFKKAIIPIGSGWLPIAWFYTRLWVFPQLIYHCFLVHPIPMIFPNMNLEGHRDALLSHIHPMILFHALFLSCLFLLHIYWFSQLVKGIYKSLRSGFDSKDVHSQIESTSRGRLTNKSAPTR